jgi:hypothetical protein
VRRLEVVCTGIVLEFLWQCCACIGVVERSPENMKMRLMAVDEMDSHQLYNTKTILLTF